ncbi:hypothetical protein [Actinokineospora sp. NBRC 105648]|uniref:hypothetical protein n=1 Tax=Actinokineospora sp. NBRC 105648 TaxID=3032206 RepID=UPI0024A60498|nr:hypothetical protein [Actinokineospora sp. NBRC 105648]GLZ40289.1 hypothetical protein Acsp05_39130 [Actinokineospora sp. NBRC 105648]
MQTNINNRSVEGKWDRQGRRLLVLGLSLAGVLGIVGTLAVKDIGEVMVKLSAAGIPGWTYGAALFGALAGFAQVIKASAGLVDKFVKLITGRCLDSGSQDDKGSEGNAAHDKVGV